MSSRLITASSAARPHDAKEMPHGRGSKRNCGVKSGRKSSQRSINSVVACLVSAGDISLISKCNSHTVMSKRRRKKSITQNQIACPSSLTGPHPAAKPLPIFPQNVSPHHALSPIRPLYCFSQHVSRVRAVMCNAQPRRTNSLLWGLAAYVPPAEWLRTLPG